MHVAGTDPYPWPYDGHLDPTRLALVVCGAQRQLIEVSVTTARVAAVVQRTSAAIRASGGHVLWVRHGARARHRNAVARLPNRRTDGWQLAAPGAPEDDIVDAGGWDGCFASDLDHTLRGRGVATVALAGFAAEITVDSTLRTLNDRGHECLVLTDACAPCDPDLACRAWSSVTMSGGIFGALGTSTALIQALISPTSPEPPESELR